MAKPNRGGDGAVKHPGRSTRVVAVVAGVLIAIAAAVWLWPREAGGRAVADGPIVIISIDTLRADRLPAYGYAKISTPHIDRLAADGVVFEHAYSHSPQTLPAHTSMFSGELPFEHGVRDNIGFTVKPGQRFLQHALKARGYATGGFVSSYVLRRQTGFDQGFDIYDDELPPGTVGQGVGMVQRPGEDTIAAALRWVDGRESPRFLLFAHIYEPHTPYSPPARFTGDPYDGEVAYSDEIIGRLLDHLRAKDLYDSATILLLSDHGEGLGDHGEDEHGVFLYRETIQIPLIVKLPDGLGGGRRVADPVQQIDLPPTILDLVTGEAPRSMRGRSLVGVLQGTGSLPEAQIYSESLLPRYHFGWSELYALSMDRYRYIKAPRPELYDVGEDPGELRSMVDDRPQVRDGMARALESVLAGQPVTAPSAVSEADRRKLAALGYVGTLTASPAGDGESGLADPKDKLDVLRRYRQAAVMASEGRYPEAVTLYRDLLREEPGMIDVWLKLADASERSGRLEDAFAAYREAITRSPREPAALTGAATMLLRLNRLDEARAHAELAIEVAPVAARDLLARLAVHQGHVEAAREHARLAAEADPTLPLPLFVEAIVAHRRGDFEAAARHAQDAAARMVRRPEPVPDLNFIAGDSLARLERYAEAEHFLEAELRVSPGHVRARAGLAMLYAATGRDREAARALEELIRHAPTPEGFEVAAELWTLFGDPARAAALRARAPRHAR
jgi:tetratricopeptide (TPR) repeat protein